MKTYNISYKPFGDDSGFLKGCLIEADNEITALLVFHKKHPGAKFYGIVLKEN